MVSDYPRVGGIGGLHMCDAGVDRCVVNFFPVVINPPEIDYRVCIIRKEDEGLCSTVNGTNIPLDGELFWAGLSDL